MAHEDRGERRLVSTEAPSRAAVGTDDAQPRRRGRSAAWAVALAAGVVAIVGALLLPFAPVVVSTPEVGWPPDPRDPAATMLMLTAYEPADLEARFSCRSVRAAATTQDGVVLSTMSPTSRDATAEALTVVSRADGFVVRSGGSELFAGPLPAGDCRFVVAGDASAMRVVLDDVVVSTTPSRWEEVDPDELPESAPEPELITPLPEVDALRTSLPPDPARTAEDLSVRMTLDDGFAHSPGPTKTALILVIMVAVVVGAVALAVPARRRLVPDRAALAGYLARLRALRPRVVDAVVPAVLVAWLFLAPITDDDGYYSAMAANVPFSGYVPNYYQLYGQGFTPFSWPYYALSWWQTTFGVAPVVLRIPALVFGIATWFLTRAFVARTSLGGSGGWGPTLARLVLAAAYLAWWLPYDMGVRPEPVVAFFTVAALVAVAEGLERRRLAVLGLGVGLASAGLMAAPTGFIALAPLVAAAPATWRLIRERSATWWAVAGCWVLVLAPGAVGSLLEFTDGAFRDFMRSQDIFAPIQRAQTWYEELRRYDALLDPAAGHHGSYARRTAVLVCLLALVWFLVLLVAARARDLVVPRRLPLAGWSTLLAFVLLLPTPSKPTHHFGAFAGLGAVFLALLLVIGPRLVVALDRDRRVPQPALVAVALSAVLVAALAGHGRAMWPYSWGLGMPAYGDFPSVRGIYLDQPLWWALGLVLATVAVVFVARLKARGRRRLTLAVSVPVLVVSLLLVMTAWTLGDVTRAAARTSDAWSPPIDAWTDPAATRCGLAGQIDVLDPDRPRPLAPAGTTATLPPLDASDAPAPGFRTEPFVPGAFYPASPPPRELPVGLPVWGSFLVPEPGANADARTGTFTTDWFLLPPADDAGLAVAVAGRTTGEVALRVEYGREAPGGFRPSGGARIGTEDPESVEWRTVALLDEAAPPTGADAVRLVATDTSTTTGGWLAFSAPTARTWVPLPQFLPPDAAVGIAWQIRTFFPCLRQPRKQDGITEPAAAAIAFGPTLDAALADWTFDPARGGLLGHAEREGPSRPLPTRVRDVGGEIDDVYVLDLRPPYPSGGYELTRDRRTVSGAPEGGIDADDLDELDDLSPPPPPAAG